MQKKKVLATMLKISDIKKLFRLVHNVQKILSHAEFPINEVTFYRERFYTPKLTPQVISNGTSKWKCCHKLVFFIYS